MVDESKLRSINEGSDVFTDFFHKKSKFNEDVTKGFFDFMNENDIDFMNGKVKRSVR